MVTIPDDVLRQAEEMATLMGLPLDEVWRKALAELRRARREDRITSLLDEVYANADSALDPTICQMQSNSLSVEQW